VHVEVPCPLCGSTDHCKIYPATRPQRDLTPEELGCATSPLATSDAVVKCRSCGLFYTSPRPDDAGIRDAYARLADREFLEERRARELTYCRQLETLDRVAGRMVPPGAPRGRLLDAGCSMGFFMKEARNWGWEVEGYDPSRWAVQYAHGEFGLNVSVGTTASATLAPASFDVVTVWDVVEHLLIPVEDFRKLAAALKPGGVLALSTHSLGSIAARVMRSRYPFLMPMHTMHFTPRTTALLFEKAGLNQVLAQPHIRYIRIGYAAEKLAQRLPRTGALCRTAVRALGLSDRHMVVTGLGIFDAFAVKPAAAAVTAEGR